MTILKTNEKKVFDFSSIRRKWGSDLIKTLASILVIFFFFLYKWQYKQNRRRHLHNLGILRIDKALPCQLKTLAWQYLWWKEVPGYKEREFSLIKDFQDSKHHPLQGKRISAAIREHSRNPVKWGETWHFTLRIPTHVHAQVYKHTLENIEWKRGLMSWDREDPEVSRKRSRDISTVVWPTPSCLSAKEMKV